MNSPEIITNGAWETVPYMTDYRAEWFSEMLVERATWAPMAPLQRIGEHVIAGPGYVWFRFWLLENEIMVEKYFDEAGQVVGFYASIGMPIQRRVSTLRLRTLILALWLKPDERVTVLHEDEFDQAVTAGTITPVESEQAEFRIRELTLAIAQKRFPPAMVRNFTIKI
ncbi:MAG: hypothetical protein NT075_15720 [Chloroflexi bacterium]|nr:hypothetical protein [Chloroflexota bacterium]